LDLASGSRRCSKSLFCTVAGDSSSSSSLYHPPLSSEDVFCLAAGAGAFGLFFPQLLLSSSASQFSPSDTETSTTAFLRSEIVSAEMLSGPNLLVLCGHGCLVCELRTVEERRRDLLLDGGVRRKALVTVIIAFIFEHFRFGCLCWWLFLGVPQGCALFWCRPHIFLAPSLSLFSGFRFILPFGRKRFGGHRHRGSIQLCVMLCDFAFHLGSMACMSEIGRVEQIIGHNRYLRKVCGVLFRYTDPRMFEQLISCNPSVNVFLET